MKILILADEPSWVINRVTDEIIRIVPAEFQKGYYQQMTTSEIIRMGNECDVVHYQNWNIQRHIGILEGLKVPLIVSCRSHRFPSNFIELSKNKKIHLHVITPQLLKIFPWATYIPNGIFGHFIPDKEFVVGFAGKPSKNKGFGLDYKGFELIKQACKELGVVFKPALDLRPGQMLEYYRSIDLYVCASENEGHSTPVMECLAMNVPVITTDVGLASTLNVHKVERNVESIKKGIERFCTHNQVEKYYWDNLKQDYYNFYKSVALEKRPIDVPSEYKMGIDYWESHRGQEAHFFSKYLLLLKHWSLPKKLGNVLELGCGPLCGFLPHLVADKKVGVDPMLGEYRKRGLLLFDKGITLLEGSMESFSLEEKFDVVLCANAIDHGSSNFDSIQNIAKTMKKGSLFCLHVHLRRPEQLNRGHTHQMRLEDLDSVVKKCGLKPKFVKFFERCPYTDGAYKTLIGVWEL